MNTCRKCNYQVAIGTQADLTSFIGPCHTSGHDFFFQQPAGNYIRVLNMSTFYIFIFSMIVSLPPLYCFLLNLFIYLLIITLIEVQTLLLSYYY